VNLRVKLVKTERTDVMCVACGHFHAEHVIVLTTGAETDSGVHTRCVGVSAVKFTRKRRSEPALPETGT
jgi:hypothetical protein